MASRHITTAIFNTNINQIPAATTKSYTDGSKSSNPESATCAVCIPSLNLEKAWTLTKVSSIFSAELQAIHQVLKAMYSRKDIPPEINVFSDSSADIKAITASTQSKNEAVTLTRDILSSFKSSETQTTIAWIPSHTGIKGNEKEYKLVSTELTAQKGDRIKNETIFLPKKKSLL